MFVGMGANSSGGYNITDSLRFRSSASAYLERTPTTAGNRQKYTISVWVKRGQLGAGGQIIQQRDDVNGSQQFALYFLVGDTLRVLGQPGTGGSDILLDTTSVYRDTSAWYHIVLAMDTTQATASDRTKLYVNGEQVTSFSNNTYPTLNLNTAYNNSVRTLIGCQRPNSSATLNGFFDGYMTEFNSVDGQALTPSDFGEYNTDGVWSPIEYTGTYGTNGFYLPMKETQQATGFNTVLWEGNNGTQDITGVGFSPDLVWIKQRTDTASHVLFDTIRGVGKDLKSNSTDAEGTNSIYGYLSAFNNDGFTVTNGTTNAGRVNETSDDYVAWCWDAGSSTVSNTDGDITASVRANPDYGFSIVTYTGNGTNPSTIGHGLGAVPKFIISKARTGSPLTTTEQEWNCYSAELGNDKKIILNNTNAAASSSNWGSTTPTSSVYTVGAGGTNGSGSNFVAYCFSEVAGFSKFGSYTGNGSTSGPTVTTGFRPAFVMLKIYDGTGSASDQWVMLDNTRSASNTTDHRLFADSSQAESTGGPVDFLDDGFQLKNSFGNMNASGKNYIYMAFADTRDFQWNFDASGNKNNWTPNNINSNASSETTYDLMSDTPSLADEDTGNFCTWNGVAIGTDATLSNGNLDCAYGSSTGTRYGTPATMGMSSGKWYWEIEVTASSLAACTAMIAITNKSNPIEIGQYAGVNTYGWAYYGNAGTKVTNDAGVAYGASYGVGDVIGVSFDADAGNLVFYKNGVSQGTAFTGLTNGPYFPAIGDGSFTNTFTVSANFGQRPFKYTPPTGFKKLNTYNLPDSSITDGSQYFAPVTYTGNGTAVASGGKSITSLEFQPDFVWIKDRTSPYHHNLSDVIRGPSTRVYSSLTNAEDTNTESVNSFDSNGFTVGNNVGVNTSSNAYVAWNWKANGSGVSNTDGTITSTVSANTTSGFSVVTYTGNSASGSTIGHGLGVKPAMVVLKNRDTASGWEVWHQNLGSESYFIRLNETSVTYTGNTNRWTAFSNSTITLGDNGTTNTSGNDYVAYCFAEVEGFSKFGSYTGNGSTDGPFVYTGFRPAFILWKRTSSTSNWGIWDTSRSTYNAANDVLFPDTGDAESENTAYDVDLLSNGFKWRTSNATINGSGSTYIYMAFAENPFKNSLAR